MTPNTQLPINVSHVGNFHEDDAASGYDFWVCNTTGMAWPGIPYWTYDPDWTPTPPGGGGETTDPLAWLTPTSECLSGWAILILVVVIAIGILGLLGSRM